MLGGKGLLILGIILLVLSLPFLGLSAAAAVTYEPDRVEDQKKDRDAAMDSPIYTDDDIEDMNHTIEHNEDLMAGKEQALMSCLPAGILLLVLGIVLIIVGVKKGRKEKEAAMATPPLTPPGPAGGGYPPQQQGYGGGGYPPQQQGYGGPTRK